MRNPQFFFNALACVAALAPVTAFADAKAEVQEVVDRFRAAIVAKDAPTLKALFLPGHDSWFSVDSEAEHRRRLARNPTAPRFHPSTSTRFADSIASDEGATEETFENVKIHADDAIATVHFDYVFLLGGKPTNRGQEAWQLVRTDDGWKIVSLVYSVDTGGTR